MLLTSPAPSHRPQASSAQSLSSPRPLTVSPNGVASAANNAASTARPKQPRVPVLDKAQLHPLTKGLIDAVVDSLSNEETSPSLHYALEQYDQLCAFALATPEDHAGLAHYVTSAAKNFNVDIAAVPCLAPKSQARLTEVLAQAKALLDASASERPSRQSAAAETELSAMVERLSLKRSTAPAVPSSNPTTAALSAMAGLPVAEKSKALIKRVTLGEIRIGSYLTSDAVPDKAWRISPTFRSGAFKKIRLALDEQDRLSVFSDIYLRETLQKTLTNKRGLLSVEELANEQKLMRLVAPSKEPMASFIDAKGRVLQQKEFFPFDLFHLIEVKNQDLIRVDEGLSPRIASDIQLEAADLYLMQAMTKAVRNFHKNNKMMLDIKPDNFLISKDYQIECHDIDMVRTPHTLFSGELYGTLGYMSPEMMYQEGPTIGRKTDIFSLGKTFIFLVMASEAHFLNPETDDFSDPLVAKTIDRELRALRAFGKKDPSDKLDESKAPPGSMRYAYRKLFQFDPALAYLVFDHMLTVSPKKRFDIGSVARALEDIAERKAFNSEQTRNALDALTFAAQTSGTNTKFDMLVENLHSMPKYPSTDKATQS